MYGMTGVCKVVDITNEKFINSDQREYYVLSPIYSDNTIIKIPVDNNKILMRKVISKGDATSLINNTGTYSGRCLFCMLQTQHQSIYISLSIPYALQ